MFFRFITTAACLFSLFSCAGSPYPRLASAAGMPDFLGRKVEISGRISDTPWQHLMGNPDGFPYAEYFDVGDFQIVVYSKTEIVCPGTLVVRGTVVKVQGSSKRPGTKADESFVEYHLAADSWECEK